MYNETLTISPDELSIEFPIELPIELQSSEFFCELVLEPGTLESTALEFTAHDTLTVNSNSIGLSFIILFPTASIDSFTNK